MGLKIKFWSYDCIVKETVWKRLAKDDRVTFWNHQTDKNWLTLANSNLHCTQTLALTCHTSNMRTFEEPFTFR